MPHNSPENYTWITYLWVIGLSILGGTVRTLTHLKMGMSFNDVCRRWFVDIIVSAFIGIITFFLCEYAQLSQLLTASFVGVSAHMGTRAIVIIEEFLYKKVMGKSNDIKGCK
jgi:hypothetical protein